MIRSLRTGVSGIQSNQTRMDVVGNNIANVNTVAFKRSRVAFGEVLGQQVLGVGRMSGGSGVNPAYVGLGVSVNSIDKNWNQGALETTGMATDLALNGDGFFVVRNGDGNLLTRAGNFGFNEYGQLVTNNGFAVQGWKVIDGQADTGALQDIEVDLNAQIEARRTEAVTIGGNLSADAEKDKPISISTVTYDERGIAHDIVIEFTRKTAIGDTLPDGSTATTDVWEFTVRDTEGNVIVPAADAPAKELAFDTSGKLVSIDGTAISDTPAASDFEFGFSWDQDDNGSEESFKLVFGDEKGSFLKQYSGSTTVNVRDQNGHASGVVTGYAITPDGVVRLNFSNGEQQDLYQIGIGNVNNPNGLQQIGENFYATNAVSGDLQLGRAGRDLRTAVVAGTLEMSNVDLATEFTDMIVTQRGFQASARVITTSDEMLQETVQLKR